MNVVPTRLARAAFSLVEITLALGIAAFCLVALLGLLPLGNNQNLDANKATAATAVASAIIADLRSTNNGGPNPSPIYQVDLPTAPGGVTTTDFFASDAGKYIGKAVTGGPVPSNARFRVAVFLTNPPSARPMEAVIADVRLSQPATQDPEKSAAATEIVTTLAR